MVRGDPRTPTHEAPPLVATSSYPATPRPPAVSLVRRVGTGEVAVNALSGQKCCDRDPEAGLEACVVEDLIVDDERFTSACREAQIAGASLGVATASGLRVWCFGESN